MKNNNLQELLKKEFTLYVINRAKKEGKDPQSYSEDELKSMYQEFVKSKTKKAAHGAKLDFIKRLKNICPEGEELVYFKKGGSVGCGCKKKEDGGEVVKAQDGAVAKFKNDLKKLQQKPKWNDTKDKELKKLSEKKNLTPQELKRLQQLRSEFKNSSNTSDYELEEGKKGMKVKKDCKGAVAKFKMHRLGGSLNGIPFYQEGTPKGGIKRDINGEYYTMPIPYGAGNGPAGQGPLYLLEAKVAGINNPSLITGEAPGGGVPTKAKNAWEALQMVKAMKAQKAAKTVSKVVKPKSIATGPKTVKLGNGYAAQIEVPDLPNYLELFDAYKMTRASRLNINNILDKLSPEERANVMKVMMYDPDKYLGRWLGNITPQRAASSIRNIRRRLPGEYVPLQVKSLDLTRPNMGTGVFLKFDDATSKTAGFKRTTNKY